MGKNARKGMLFAGGLLLGVLVGAAGMMSLRGGDGPYASSPPTTRVMGAPASTAFVTAVAGNCEMAPMLPNGGAGDGRETLQAKPGEASAGEVGSLILSGKEAAASGRQRDAEIDFLNACRKAAALQDGDPVPLADAMYQLGRHYAMVGALGAPKSTELFRRAERLYSASLEAYRARYGDTGEKTRFAREGLATVQQATGGKPPAVIAKAPPPAPVVAPQAAPQPVEPAPAPAPKPAPAAETAVPAHEPPVAAKAPEPPRPASEPPQVATARRPVAPERSPQPQPQQRRTTQPSFNCAQARSVPEKLICGDEELARLDRETGRLHQRARQAADDPRAFQRNSDAEWQKREQTCRDKDCLRAWYARRQQELSEQAAQAPARPAAVAPAPTRAATPAGVQPRTAAAMADDERSARARPRPARVAPRDDGDQPWTRTSGGPPAGTPTAEGSPGEP